MAGHSHWHNIRHKKTKQDAIKARNNKKFSQEIMNAVFKAGNNIDNNSYLKSIIQTAKSNGVSKDVIDKAVKKASETKVVDGSVVVYEIFGDESAAVIAVGFSENSTKSSMKIKEIASKYGFTMAKCSHLFKHEGIAELSNCTIDEILEIAGDEVEDFFEETGELMISFKPENIYVISDKLKNYNLKRCEVIYQPHDYITIQNNSKNTRLLLGALDELEFVHNIFYNFEELG